MIVEFKLELFRFDATKDYLPYYKKYFINIDEDLTLLELLKSVKKEDPYFEYDDKESIIALKVNDQALEASTPLKNIYEKFGENLTIEPLSIKMANKDLIINKDSFYKAYDLIKDIVSDDYIQRYKELICYFYSSISLHYKSDFQGDALFILVHEILKSNFDKKDELLQVIANKDNGIWFHTPVCHKVFDKKYDLEKIVLELKQEILKSDFIDVKAAK